MPRPLSRIILVRHGRSAHTNVAWLDNPGFDLWREAYEAAGILPGDAPPTELRAAAATASKILSSDAQRAIESAHRLAPNHHILITPLLAELELQPPMLGRLRLPLVGWALVFGIRSLYHRALRRPNILPTDLARAREAATLMMELGQHDGVVLAVTHASMRAVLARELERAGWHISERRGWWRHWSAWSFEKKVA